MADIFIEHLNDKSWQRSSAERVKKGANPNLSWRHLVDAAQHDSHALSLGCLNIPVGEHLPLHSHAPQEIYFVLQGQGMLLLKNEDTRLIEHNNAVYIPENALHGVRNTGNVDLKLLWVFPTDSWNDVAYYFNK
ncbi:MAG: cupin domain-containing protein [SAR324 cluster bacterium]|nr:cupin domain-containing protein [SAR324 cluster bacterium]